MFSNIASNIVSNIASNIASLGSVGIQVNDAPQNMPIPLPKNPQCGNGTFSPFEKTVQNEINRRKEEDSLWKLADDPHMSDDVKSHVYNCIVMKSMYLMGSDYKAKLSENVYPDTGRQGSAMECPIDFHKGPSLFPEDTYTYIYGEETDKNIVDNCNEKLFKSINNTAISEGMMLRSQGHKWLNGIILYNSHSIVIRNPDNNFGQPGFLTGYFYYDRLAIEVMNRYIVPALIKAVNDGTINEKNGYNKATDIISNVYKKVYSEKLNMLSQPNIDHINEKTLFADAPLIQKIKKAPSKEESDSIIELRKDCEEKDEKIDRLEKRVDALASMVEMLMNKLNVVEELCLDMSIHNNKN